MRGVHVCLILMLAINSYAQLVGVTMKTGHRFESQFVSCNRSQVTLQEGAFECADIAELAFANYSEGSSSQYETLRSVGVRVTFAYQPGTAGPIKFRTEDIIADLPVDDGQIIFSEVVPLDSVNETEIYLRAKMFFVNHFRSAKDVIQFDDKEASTIVGQGWEDILIPVTILTTTNTTVQMWQKIKIQGRPGRYRYEIFDIKFVTYATSEWPSITTAAEVVFRKSNYYTRKMVAKNVPESYRNAMLKSISETTKAIKVAMVKGVKSKDDW